MGPRALTSSRALAVGMALAVLATACGPTEPGPTPTPSPGSDTASKRVGDLALEACDPDGILPCHQQAVVLSDPIAGAGVSLTYSSEWADGRLDRPHWSAAGLGLGGWSVDVLDRYDAEHGVILSGDGSWRIAAAADIGSGERAVPTRDGLRYSIFDAEWRHTRTVDAITGATLLTFAYDDAGRLTRASGHIDHRAVDLTVERSTTGEPIGLAGIGGGSVTRPIVTAEGTLGGIARPDGTALIVGTDPSGLIVSSQATGRGTTSYAYDPAGRLASVVDADGVTTRLTFQAASGVVERSIDAGPGSGAHLRAERDGDRIRRSLTDADGTVTELVTDGDGAIEVREADGTVTSIGAAPHPRWATAAPILSPIVVERSDGSTVRTEISTTMGTGAPKPGGGSWQTEVVIDGATWTDAYDHLARTLTTTDPAGRQAALIYDDEGRLVEHRAPGAPVRRYAYDAFGRLASESVGTGPGTATTTYSYDQDAGTVTTALADGSLLTRSYTAFGSLVGSTVEGEITTLTRDLAGAIQQVRAGNHPATTLGYSAAGRLTAFIPPALGADQSYEVATYADDTGLLATLDGPGDRSIALDYDDAGRVIGWDFGDRHASADYGSRDGLLRGTETSDGVATGLTYTGGALTGLRWSGPVAGEVSHEIDVFGRTTVEIVNGDPVERMRDVAGFLIGIGPLAIALEEKTGLPIGARLGRAETAARYDADGRLTTLTTVVESRTVLELHYAYDVVGRIVRFERRDAGGEPAVVEYEYDAAGRIAAVHQGSARTEYGYDEAGNRTAVTADGGTVTASYDERDRLLAFGTARYTHDPDGTLRTRSGPDGTATYDFDDLGALRSVVLADGRRVEYVVDAGGRRIGREVDGRLADGYLYGPDDRIAAWTDGSGEVRARFAYDDRGYLALVSLPGRELLVVTDQLGSPLLLVDGRTGEIARSIAYDAWGNAVSDTAPGLTPIGFAGGLADPDTGLVHFGARDYDPATGRWTASDPLRYDAGDPNLYRYVMNDPVNLADPTGLSACAPTACRGTDSDGATHAVPGARRGGAAPVRGGGPTRGSGPYRDGGPSRSQPNRPAGQDWVLGGPCALCPPQNVSRYWPASPPGSVTTAPRPDRPQPTSTGCGFLCVPLGPVAVCASLCSFGDPHFLTGDGLHVDFQAAGEFIVARSADEALVVQARFEPPGGRTDVTRATALAMSVAGDRVAFYADPQRPLVVNGSVVARADYTTRLPNGGMVERHGTQATVTWPDGSTVRVDAYTSLLNFGVSPSDAIAPELVGLLGSRDGKRSNDLAIRGGAIVDPAAPRFHETLHGAFADSWRVSDAESLFDYRSGESTASFTRRDVPGTLDPLATLDADTLERAEAVCRASGVAADPILAACVLDFGLTGDPTYVASAATVATTLALQAARIVDRGPRVEMGETVRGSTAARRTIPYHFDAAAGDVVYLDAVGECVDGMWWTLLAPDGRPLVSSASCSDLGRQILEADGAYVIELGTAGAAAGEYGFRVVSGPEAREATYRLGRRVEEAIEAIAAVHRYTFAADAGDVVYADALGECVDGLVWTLFAPDGRPLVSAVSCNDLGRQVLEADGDHVVEVSSPGTATGEYAFRVIAGPAPRATALELGAEIEDRIGEIAARHRYTFTASAGDVVHLRALGGDCGDGLSWTLLRPDGAPQVTAAACNDLGRQVLDQDGEYVVEVYGRETGTGDYAFRVDEVP